MVIWMSKKMMYLMLNIHKHVVFDAGDIKWRWPVKFSKYEA